ncbi:hypothetical protein C4G41_RS22985 [Vibrio parahaemolyticus]|uniref:hypothetical protein n=1 Tax=Vibrio harveyi group TaxID=717610 RepID=UPI0015C0E8E1|nr:MULTISPECIES: hypothetical protein [Vibrio harveyi group]EGQ9118469.1 hypothetical protein [Vibrio parahaemolyticus]EGR2758360.1 hypothetical protein [Vibrio parahaemolyticus]EHH3659970.1 hypothetical protein [Vibrio parahaemolyticus]EJF4094289.1 hypothetical protein [Vibrio parahaemolyticus]EJG0303436.1 hypothetical protein [Vibrio parahaemolyticus]
MKSKDDIKSILEDKSELCEFASLNNITTEAAKVILQRMLDKPEISEDVNKYIFSDKSSDDLKGYVSGEEKGYKRGHDAGFAKGAFLGVLAGAGAVAAAIFSKK